MFLNLTDSFFNSDSDLALFGMLKKLQPFRVLFSYNILDSVNRFDIPAIFTETRMSKKNKTTDGLCFSYFFINSEWN